MTKSQWTQLLKIQHEFNKRGEIYSRKKIQETMRVSHSTAREWDSFLKHKGVISGMEVERVFDGERVGVLADIHIPYHDNVALETALSYLDEFKPNTIVLLGDMLDFYKVSRFTKKIGRHSVGSELGQGRMFLQNLRYRFPGAKIIYLEGNHENRLERYILENAAEIADLMEDLLISKLGLVGSCVEYRAYFFSIGKLFYLHGHEKAGGGNAEHICNVVFRQTLDHTIFGHHHRQQEKVFKRIDGGTLWTGGVGYLAGPMEYAPLNQWSQGFATIVYQANGHFKARLHKIQDGIIY